MNLRDIAQYTVEQARKAGADQSDVYLEQGRESTVTVRLGELEVLKQASSKGLGLRVFLGNRLGFAYTSDFDKASLKTFADRTVEMAREISTDPHNVLPETALKAPFPDLDLFDPQVAEIPMDWKIKAAKEMEAAGMDCDKRINNSGGSSFYDGDSQTVIANSLGVLHSYRASNCSLGCSLVAEQDGKKQTNGWSCGKRFFKDLESPEQVASVAAERTLRMLGAVKPHTQVVPVVFDPQMAASLIGIIFGALNGDAIYKRSSFMVDKLGQKIAPDNFTLMDDALRRRGPGSQPVDDEGIPTTTHMVIDGGALKMYFYDAYAAHKAGVAPTGNARRGYSSTPSVGSWNLYLKPGDKSPQEIIKSVDNGLYLTSTMGFGVNFVSGDMSKGASGIWIEKGELAYPVEEATIAGNLLEMLQNVTMIGSDLEFRRATAAPTIRIDGITVSGK
jgi:PmbA protein